MGKQETKVHSFDVLKHLSVTNGHIKVAPLTNIISIERTKKGGKVTIGIDAQTTQELLTEPMNGCLVLVPASAYSAAQQHLQSKLNNNATDQK